MKLKTLDDYEFKDKLVLMRIDVNSPIVSGKVVDNPRFKEMSVTIKELIKKRAKLVLIAHQGRKKEEDYLESLEQHSKILSRHLGREIKYIDGLFERKAIKLVTELKYGEVVLMRNVRAYKEEYELGNSRFVSFCRLFDIYVNEAFSVSHRNQGSIVIPPRIIDSCVGRAFEREINSIDEFHNDRSKKSVYLIGGQKIEDYLKLLNFLKNRNSKILVSGVLANVILIALGRDLGYEKEWIRKHKYLMLTKKLKKIYQKSPQNIILPLDFAVGSPDIKRAKRKEVDLKDFPVNEKIWDVGHRTVELFKEYLDKADNIFMKGPLGYSEIEEFSYGTREIIRKISELGNKKGVFSLLAGGHLSTSIEKYYLARGFSQVSNSGGALIKYLLNEEMPGIVALEKGKGSFK